MMSWVDAIDAAFVEKRFGDAARAALERPRVYAEPPVMQGGKLVATIVPAADDKLGTPLKVAARVQGELVDFACACRRGHICEHVVWLLVDVAYHPAMRAALAAGADTSELVKALPILRARAVEERTLDARVAAWAPPRRFDDDYELSITVTERASILLEHRRASTRAAVSGRDVLEARLTTRRRQLVELTSPYHADRDQLVATRGAAAALIELLRGEIGLFADHFKARVRYEDAPVTLRADAEGDRLVARWSVPEADDAVLFPGPRSHLWIPSTKTFHVVDASVDLDAAQGMQRIPSLPLDARVGRALLVRNVGIPMPAAEAFGLPPMEKPTFELRVSGLPLEARGELLAVYSAGKIPLGGDDTFRDVAAETHAMELAREAGFDDELVAVDDDAVRLWTTGIFELRKHFDVLVNESLVGLKVGPPVTMSLRVEGEVGWLDVEREFRAGALKVEIERMHRAIAAHRKWVALSDGTLAKISDEIAMLTEELGPEPRVRLPRHQMGRVERWTDIGPVTLDEAVLPPLREAVIPSGVRAELRPYQREGLAWLQRLRRMGVGGLLADDMGLGKTLMTLALLAGEDGPSLVVCPTSLVDNWKREAERFTPELRVLVWTGKDRAKDLSGYDLVVTTYGLLRREQDRLAVTRWNLAILDEAQNIKNASSDTARAARRLEARMRLALTGTPIENRLAELWSIMTFANPGMLGTETDFDHRYVRVTTRSDELRALVKPFILRRTKEQVLDDLPPKTEIERVCIFGRQQRRLYDALALALRDSVKKDPKHGRRMEIAVLTAILRLRQMACDPRLVDPEATAADSAKRIAFLDLVRELVSEERRALVFSQFVELLQLWRADLDAAKVRYEYLDGSTKNRAEVVDRFQNGDAPLFLISLKAGGAGLNLTAADTVIHLDPWWNPAAEDQATDRAHRIGQTKPVTVVRLVAKGSIEDRIELMKNEKRDLAALLADAEGDVDDD